MEKVIIDYYKIRTTKMAKWAYLCFTVSLLLHLSSCYFASNKIESPYIPYVIVGLYVMAFLSIIIVAYRCIAKYTEIFKDTGLEAYEDYMCFFPAERENIKNKFIFASECPDDFINSVKNDGLLNNENMKKFKSFFKEQKINFQQHRVAFFYLKIQETLLIFILNFLSAVFIFSSLYIATCMKTSCCEFFCEIRPPVKSFFYWFIDGLYFSMTTVASLGYSGGFYVKSSCAQLIIIIELIFFFLILSMIFASVLSFLNEKTSYNVNEIIKIFEKKIKDKVDELDFERKNI